MALLDLSDLARATDPAESAFLSLVVGRAVRDVTRPEAIVTLRGYGAAARPAAMRILSLAMYRALSDRVVTAEEVRELAHLQWLLDVSEEEAYGLRQRYVYPYYQNAFAALLGGAPGTVRDEEIHATTELARDLGLSTSEAEMLMSRAVAHGFAPLPESPT